MFQTVQPMPLCSKSCKTAEFAPAFVRQWCISFYMCDLAPVSNCRVFCTCLLVWSKEQAVGDVFLVSWECLPGHSETRQLAVRAGPPSVKLEHLTVTTCPSIDRHTYNTCRKYHVMPTEKRCGALDSCFGLVGPHQQSIPQLLSLACIHVYIQEGMLPILASKRAVIFYVCVSPCMYNIMCSTGQWIVLHIHVASFTRQ